MDDEDILKEDRDFDLGLILPRLWQNSLRLYKIPP